MTGRLRMKVVFVGRKPMVMASSKATGLRIRIEELILFNYSLGKTLESP